MAHFSNQKSLTWSKDSHSGEHGCSYLFEKLLQVKLLVESYLRFVKVKSFMFGLSTPFPDAMQKARIFDPFDEIEVFYYVLGKLFSVRVVGNIIKLFSIGGFL